MRIWVFILLCSLSVSAAQYEFINDFPAFIPPPDWYGGQHRNIIIDDNDSVTVFFYEAIPHTTYNQNFQIFYRRFDKYGNAHELPKFVTDSSLYQARSSMHAGHNRKGKWVISNRTLANCPQWPFCEENVRAWVSNANGTAVDTEFVVGGELYQTYRNSNSVAAVDSQGNFAVAWVRLSTDDSLGQILYQLFTPEGIPRTSILLAGDSYLPDGTEMAEHRLPKIAMAPSGDFVIVWQASCTGPSCYPVGWNPKIFMRLFNADGTPKTEEMRACDIREESPVPCWWADVAMADDGRFAVSYGRIIQPCLLEYNALPIVKRFDPDGNALGPEIILDSLYCLEDLNLATFVSSDSAFNLLVGWQNSNGGIFTGQFANLVVQKIDTDGNLVGQRYRINDRADQVFMFTTPVAINNNGLAGFYWGEMKPDKENTTLDRMQLMDFDQVGIYVPGDADNNTLVNVSDAVYLIQYIFAGGQSPASLCLGDADGNEFVTISDAVVLINYIFSGGTINGDCK